MRARGAGVGSRGQGAARGQGGAGAATGDNGRGGRGVSSRRGGWAAGWGTDFATTALTVVQQYVPPIYGGGRELGEQKEGGQGWMWGDRVERSVAGIKGVKEERGACASLQAKLAMLQALT